MGKIQCQKNDSAFFHHTRKLNSLCPQKTVYSALCLQLPVEGSDVSAFCDITKGQFSNVFKNGLFRLFVDRMQRHYVVLAGRGELCLETMRRARKLSNKSQGSFSRLRDITALTGVSTEAVGSLVLVFIHRHHNPVSASRQDFPEAFRKTQPLTQQHVQQKPVDRSHNYPLTQRLVFDSDWR